MIDIINGYVSGEDIMGADNRNLLSSLFFSVAADDFNIKNETLEWFNNAFGLEMRLGIFRNCDMRLDCFQYTQIDITSTILDKYIDILKTSMDGLCYDTLFAKDFLLCRGILNYPHEKEKQVLNALEASLAAFKRMPDVSAVADITLGLSMPYEKLVDSHKAMRQVREAMWLRFSKGKGKLIEWEKNQPLTETSLRTLEYYKQKLKKNCILLDTGAFLQTIKEFFSLPKRILGSTETRALLYEVEQYMYEVNRELISEFSDVATVHKAIREAHKLVRTLDEYFDCYTRHLSSLFDQINEHASKNSKLVKQAKYFVKQNIASKMCLDDVASQIGLNSVYFSHLFKKETGENFTDYVLGCKIDSAKSYLSQEKMKIDAIASLTGFSNAKYFSKKFKEKERLTPSEYRKVHG